MTGAGLCGGREQLRDGGYERPLADHRIAEQQASGPFGLCGFKQTSSRTCPPFYTDGAVPMTDPVSHASPMVLLQGVQAPIAAGHDPNAPVGSNQNRRIFRRRTHVDDIFGGFQQALGILDEPAHKYLFGAARTSMRTKFTPRASRDS